MERIEDFSSTLMLRSGSGTVPGAGQTSFSIHLLSYKVKSINGKPQSARTLVGFEYSLPSWVTYKTSVENSNRDGYSLIVDIAKNPGSTSRSGTITLTQRESGKKDTFTITQESSVTYTGYIKMVSNTLPLGGNKGNTAQILVMSYLNGSDGSKKEEGPNVGSAPDWCSVSVAKVGTLENHYMLSLTALSDNNTGANRSGYLFLTCGDANLSIPVTQESPQVDSTFTLQGLTPNSNYFLFASGHFPSSNTSFQYLMIIGNGSEITLSIPCTVNMSSPGQRSEADTGDRVSVYQYSNDRFVSAGSFTVPSAGGTVSI